MQELQTPKQGYKFENLGLRIQKLEIPIEWRIEKLSDLILDIRGGAPLKPDDFTSTGFPVLHKGDIKPNDVLEIGETNPFCSYTFAESQKKSIIDNSFVVVTLRDLVPSGPAIGLIAHSHGSYLLAQGAYGFHHDGKKVDSRYLVHLSNSYFYRKYMRSISVGSTQIHIRTPEFLKVKIPIPPMAEQQKIASIISSQDELIQKTDQIIEQTKKLKNGLMQRLLTKGIGHTRFKTVRYMFAKYIEIPENWQIVRVSDIAESSVPGRNKPERFDGDIPWITISDLDNIHVTDSKNGLRVTRDEVKKNSGKIIPPRSVIMTCVGEFGIVGIATREIVLNQQLHAFVCSKDVLPYFLAISLASQKNYMYSVSTTTTIPYMNKDNCDSIPIILPPLPEQEKIITNLSQLESYIINYQSYRQHVENMKKGLMQKLLTGRIRVKL